MSFQPFGSPIELEFAAGVVAHGGMQFVPKFGLTYEQVRAEAPKQLGAREQLGCKRAVVFPQVQIAKYTADFFAMFWDRRDLIMPIAIECDGHEFHERTPQQAQHDKRRDRFFASNSIFVMRFTGSEIRRDPIECAREVYRATEFIVCGPSARLMGVCWLLSDAENDDLLEREQDEAERAEYAKKVLIEAEIMSGTYEGLWP